jgi:hypothetical protein
MKAYECDVCGKLYRSYHKVIDDCGKSIFGGQVNAIQFMDTDAINRVGGGTNACRKYFDLCPECLGAFTATYLRRRREGKESEEKGEE